MKKKSWLSALLGGGTDKDAPDSEERAAEQQDMIRGVRELSETTVKEVMIPRIDTVFIALDTEREELFEKICESGHSRFPVYRETIDDVAGVLYVKDVLRSLVKDGTVNVEALLRKPFFVPESKRIDTLLREFKRRRVHIAVAVDEYGGVSGIVSMEDIIEEIVGDIRDEFDNEREDVMKLSDNSWICDARVNIEDLNEKLGLDLRDDDFDTLGGFVFDLFGKIPVRYEKVSRNNVDFIVQEVDGHKIDTVKIVINRDADGHE